MNHPSINIDSTQIVHETPEWYMAIRTEGKEKIRGPLKTSEILILLEAKTLTGVDYLYREKEAQWLRICDLEEFKNKMSSAPSVKPVATSKVAPPPPPAAPQQETQWFIYQNNLQSGPFGTPQVKSMVSQGQVLGSAFVWQESFTEWKPLSHVVELQVAPAQVEQLQASSAELRKSTRKSVKAKIYATNHKDLLSGTCQDISLGGMKIIAEGMSLADLQRKVGVGSKIRINIAPAEGSLLKPFVAEGVVVRVLDQQGGFGCEFTQLPEKAKATLQNYLAAV